LALTGKSRLREGGVPKYVSADSAPAEYAVRRPASTTVAFLVIFGFLSAVVALVLEDLTALYALALGAVLGIDPSDLLVDEASLSFRPFLALFLFLLSAFAVGSLRARVRILLFSLAVYGTAVFALDASLGAAGPLGAPEPLSQTGGLAAALVGLVVIAVATFTQYGLPAGVDVRRTQPRSVRSVLVLITSTAIAGLLVAAALQVAVSYLGQLATPFLSAFASMAVLFFLTVLVLLFLVSVRQRKVRPSEGPLLSIGFLVPAYNEAEGIEECIEALDAAAASYSGPCRLYLVDNCSVDGTEEVGANALARCRALTGEILRCDKRGKTYALNFGLGRMREDVVVRVDADTVVSPMLLQQLVPYFWDPRVGGVTGLPLTKNSSSWFARIRLIEVYYNVAFVRAAQGALDSIMVMPGILASYRRELATRLGGFGEGFNGEDADITVRIGRLGYRIVVDPEIHVRTEVPATLAHLREQRQRWSRGLFHMAARNMSMIWMRQGLRGLFLLPWAILNACRRSVMVPLLLCALTVEAIEPAAFSLREVSLVGGFVVGVQIVFVTTLLVAYRQFGAIPAIPAYIVFRLFRAFVALEALLTLRLSGRAAALAPERWIEAARARAAWRREVVVPTPVAATAREEAAA
jgi:cellulose synthase/poly-beta-1,6-N-acetylglucosamine synthase-like glycosyltransferase